MIATHNGNGHAKHVFDGRGALEILDRLERLDRDYLAKRTTRDTQSSYAAGQSGRMSPIPTGIDPLGTDADYHYRTAANYYLMAERGREAVRNHPLIEQGINRLVALLKLGEFTFDIGSGDTAVDADIKAKWRGWTGETVAGRNECDYEGTRSLSEIDQQSYFNQVVDGDILHLPLADGRLQTWECHHIRTPYGWASANSDQNGLVHGAEVVNGRTVAYHVTPLNLRYYQSVTSRNQSRRFAVFDEAGNVQAFWSGFRHRFFQRRGISRLSPPREAMNGFDDLNYAHTKSALRRAIISYLMTDSGTPQVGPLLGQGSSGLPQAGDRYAASVGLGVQTAIFEQSGEPAQIIRAPDGKKLEGWNANMPGSAFFEHAGLMLTMLAVNLDIPVMFLLLDGSLVNFHGGRMVWDQVKIRLQALQRQRVRRFYGPIYEWKIRQWTTPGTSQFDPALAAAAARGANLLAYTFRPASWPYVKPSEDVAAEDQAERRNLKAWDRIQTDRGDDPDDVQAAILSRRASLIRDSLTTARAIIAEFPDAKLDLQAVAAELRFGQPESGNVPSTPQEQPPNETADAARTKGAAE